MELPDENNYRFVAVLNKKIELGSLLNALGHMAAGLAGGYGKASEMYFLDYQDKNGGLHPFISHFPFIVLSAENSNHIRKTRKEVISLGLPFTDFTSTMAIGTSEEQLDATFSTDEESLEYYGLCVFGPSGTLKEITKKFSLFR